MTEQWNYQTNLKPKPNAQGTLFSGGKSQMDPARRYPRGYTPERMAAVRGNTVVNGANGWDGEIRGVHPGSLIESTYRTLARSSVPAESLQRVQFHVNNPNASLVMARDGVAGSYANVRDTGHVKLSMNAVNDPTVIHEVGHHVSHLSGLEHAAYDSPLKRGEEEGFADNYADRHYVPLPKRQMKREMREDNRRGLDRYEPLADQIRDSNGRSRRGDFQKGYDRTRPLDSRVPNEQDLVSQRSTASLDAFLTRRDSNPRLPGLDL